jgi:hypothetical protein
MLGRIVCSVVVLGAVAASAQGQIGRAPRQANAGPSYWVGLSMAYVDGLSTTDNATGSAWNFGYTSQIRATLEKALGTGGSVGISAGFSNPPLTYSTGSAVTANCAGSCQATASLTQYMGFFSLGSPGRASGFRGGLTVEGGVTQLSNFHEKTSNASLPPSSGSYDPTFGFGFTFGYSLSQISDIYIGQMSDFVLHPQNSAVTNQSAPRMFHLRGGFRIGF